MNCYSDSVADDEEFPAYAEPIERSDTDYYYDFESDQLRGAWPSKTTTVPPAVRRRPLRGRQPASSASAGRWPSKAASEEPQRAGRWPSKAALEGPQQAGRWPSKAASEEPQQASQWPSKAASEGPQQASRWPSKAASEGPQQAGRWPSKAALEKPQQTQPHYDHYGDYPQSQGDYTQSQGDYPQSQGDYPQSQGDYPQSQGDYPQSQGDYPQSQGDYPQTQGHEDYEPQRVATDDEYQKLENSYGSGFQDQERQDYDEDESSLGSFGSFYSADYTTLEATSQTAPPKFEIKKETNSNAYTETATTPMPIASDSTAQKVGPRTS